MTSKHPTYSKVYQNNMDDESFIGVTKGIDKILKTPKSAYLHYEEIQNCIFESIPWKKTVGYVTMALFKDSPLIRYGLDLVSIRHLHLNTQDPSLFLS